jgi:hypothetical protein
MNKVTLQINVSPLDFPRVIHLLPHQLKTFSSQCEEKLIILDLKKSRSRKSSGSQWDTNTKPILKFLQELKNESYPDLRIEEVDYSDKIRKCMSKTIMRRGVIPDKDYSGGPFYSYYFGLFAAKYDYVLHIDADMMFGGGSGRWVQSAISVLENDTTVFSCSPLPGPPVFDLNQMPSFYRKKFNPIGFYRFPYSYLYKHFSTRCFLINKNKLYKNISVQYPNLDHFIKALFNGSSPYRYPEGTISDMIRRKRWHRVDFSRSSTEFWCLHPNGNPLLNKLLPQVLSLMESNQFPDSQRGYCDINNDFLNLANAKG